MFLRWSHLHTGDDPTQGFCELKQVGRLRAITRPDCLMTTPDLPGITAPPLSAAPFFNELVAKKEGMWRSLRLIRTAKCSPGGALLCKVFGYRFGYRRQFALISASYAKLQVGMDLLVR
jgi:hypothetical protein